MSYKAIIAKIWTSPHPNADRLKIGNIAGHRVIVDLATQDGELHVFFPDDGQLSEAYAKEHDLVRRKDENGNHAGGFFEENRRVRCQPFRGVKSEGFAMPLQSLAFTGYNLALLKEGDQIDVLNGVSLCNKYVTKATASKIAQNGQKANPLKAAFPQHYDTTQFRYASIEKGDLIIVTEKEHGTSVRYGHVTVRREDVGFAKWWNWFWGNINYKDNPEYVLGTRRAILKQGKSQFEFEGGYYTGGEPYNTAAKQLHSKLKLGEIVYGELVGFTSNGATLFSHTLTKLPDLEKIYGSPMIYSYGCTAGTNKFRVYRITQDGRDLSWFEMLQRCKELEVEMVTEMSRFIYDGDKDKLNAYIETLLEGPSLIDETHIREGVCIRVENQHGHKVYKEKSFSFKLAEGIVKDNDAYIDLEEVS